MRTADYLRIQQGHLKADLVEWCKQIQTWKQQMQKFGCDEEREFVSWKTLRVEGPCNW